MGGFAVDHHPAPLPADLERFVDGSGDAGVIVVSFGTLVRHYGQHWTRLFAAAFARLPQRVVWRNYDDDNETSTNDTTTLGYDDRSAGLIVLNHRLNYQSFRFFTKLPDKCLIND